MDELTKFALTIVIATSGLLCSGQVLADEIGTGKPQSDPDSTPPDTSTESVESTDTWWNDLLELFDLDTSDEE
jgi:hypothetical protein